MARQRGKDLLAVDDPSALNRLRLGAERDTAGRGRAAFRERLRINGAIIDDALVVYGTAAFVLGAGGGIHIEIVRQRTGPQRRTDMHVPGQRGGAAIAADLGGRQSIGLVVRAEAAVRLGNGDAEQARAMQIAIILGREFRLAIVSRRAAREHALAELARPRDDSGLFVVQAKRGGIEDRRVQIDLVGRSHALARLYRHYAVTWVAAAWAFRKESSAALKAAGRSRLARWPAPSSSTQVADGM